MAQLIIRQASGTRTLELGEDAVGLGRTADNTVKIEDSGASRKHAQILYIGSGWEVVDLGSRNGTQVNGEKVARKVLKGGDTIAIGTVTLTFQDGSEESIAATAVMQADEGLELDGLDIEELDLGGGDSPAAAAPSRAAAASGPAGACALKVLAGEREGEQVALDQPRVTFGRRSSNTLAFKDQAVSGVHAEIVKQGNGWVLRDLGSTNGTTVDGEPVVETMLRHNSRIRIGAQRFVFVDTSIADIESALVDADDDDWGMMRGEVDVAAGGRGGGLKAALVSLGVVAIVGGGAAALVLTRPPKPPEVASIPDNRIVDHSFEDGVVRWFSDDDEGATARIVGDVERPMGASGVRALEVLPPAEGIGRVAWSSGDDLAVTSGSAYEIAARVGGGAGAVVVTWLTPRGAGPVRQVATPVVEGDGTWPETRAVVVAPARAAFARIELAAFDGMTATFDDVVVRRAADGGLKPVTIGELKVLLDANGRLELVRSGDILVTEAGAEASVDVGADDLLTTALEGTPETSGGIAARVARRGGAGWGMKVEPGEGGALLTAEPAGDGALTMMLPSGNLPGAVTLVMARTARVLGEAEEHEEAGVEKIIVGGTEDGPAPFVLAAPAGSSGYGFRARRTSRGLRVRLTPPEGGAHTVRVGVDLSLEDRAAGELLREADRLRQSGELGGALQAFERVAAEFHYRDQFRKRALDGQATILTDGKKRLETARNALRGASQFQSVAGLEAAVAAAERLAADFAGHAIGEEATTIAGEARTALAKAREDVVEDRVTALYRRAVDYQENERPSLALHLFEEILRIAPEDNEFREVADEQVEALRATIAQRRKELFGAR